jgi:hypothetical protein
MTINITPGWNITPGIIIKDYNISDLLQFTTPAIISTANAFQVTSLAVNSNDTFVVVGNFIGASTGAGLITSNDGVNWSGPNLFNTGNTYTVFPNATLSSVASSPNRNSNLFVAVGSGSFPDSANVTALVTSSNNGGITWTYPSIITQNYTRLGAVAISLAGRSVAVGFDQNNYYPISTTSTDGVTWSTPAPIITNRQIVLSAIAVNTSNVFVAFGGEVYSNNGYSFISVNGTTWSGPFLMPFPYYQIKWLDSPFNAFFAVGSDGGYPYYSTSTDGINWSDYVHTKYAFQTIASNKNGYIVGTYIPDQPDQSYYSVSSNISSISYNYPLSSNITSLNDTYRAFDSTIFPAITIVSDSSGRFVVVGNSPYPNAFPMYSTSYNVLY